MAWSDVLKAVIPIVVACLAWLLGQVNSFSERLTKIEGKFGELQKLIESSQNSMTRIMIGTAGTVLTGILGLVVVVLQK